MCVHVDKHLVSFADFKREVSEPQDYMEAVMTLKTELVNKDHPHICVFLCG